jgi:hypothetical protein
VRRCSVPEIPIEQAIELLSKEVGENLPADEVQEIYNELFRRGPLLVEPTDHSPEATKLRIEQLVAHFRGGRGLDELIELWELIFTGHRDVWYNEVDDLLHYCDDPSEYLTEWESGTG